MARDPYEVLGVSRNASDEEIKKPTESLQRNITQTAIPATPRLRQR